MGTGIFFNLPAHGHINPTLPLVRELVNRGERIIYYSTAEFRPEIEASGAEFRSYHFPDNFKPHDLIAKNNFISLAGLLLLASEKIIQDFLNSPDHLLPDYILHDSMCPWGKYIAHHLKIKAINTTSTFVLNHNTLNQSENFTNILLNMVRNTGLRKTATILRKKWSLDKKFGSPSSLKDIFQNVEDLSLVFTSEYFQPQGTSLTGKYQFIGPSIGDRPDVPPYSLERLAERPLVYISLGTLAKDKFEFFRQCIRVFSNTDYNVLISDGGEIEKEQLGAIPANVFIEAYVPQLDVLQKASLFISHGGMNSVNESLYFGVPLILFPQQAEQAMVAKRVEELGAGVILSEDAILSDLYNQAERMMSDQIFYENAQKIRESFRAAGGFRRGAELILDYTDNH